MTIFFIFSPFLLFYSEFHENIANIIMEVNFINNNLVYLFNNINSLGWIPVLERGYGSSGLLFENLIGLQNNCLQIADYNGYEIKVRSMTSKFPITLFSMCFNNKDFDELRCFVDRYGVKNRTYKVKTMSVIIRANRYNSWGKNLKFKLVCDRNKKKIFLLVCHSNGKIIEKKCYWDFEEINRILINKVANLCVISCFWRKRFGFNFVKFIDINFFSLINFERFLECIEKGTIFVKIKCGVHKSGKYEGLPYYHGIEFQVNYEDLLQLFLQKK